MISNIVELASYSEYKLLLSRYDLYPDLVETASAYAVSFQRGGIVYHRHSL